MILEHKMAMKQPLMSFGAMMLLAALAAAAIGQDPVSLIDSEKPLSGWNFGNGPEFPGAKGSLEVAGERFREKPVLRLAGDFAKGGNYVQAAVGLPEGTLDSLSFWLRAPAGAEQTVVRLIDAEGRCHQLRLKIDPKGGWQQVVVPVKRYFKTMGTPDAIELVTQYQSWDGVADAKKHDKRVPAGQEVIFLASRAAGIEQPVVLLGDIVAHMVDEADLKKTIRLDEMLQAGELDWGFNLGQEFPGAKGGLELVADQPETGRSAMRLWADFTGGGAYVGVRKSYEALDIAALEVFRLKIRSSTARSFAIRMVDGTGQCHQRKHMPLNADGKWHDVELVPTEIAGGEHWGGANDGKWHHPLKLIEIMLNTRSDEAGKPELLLADLQADVVVRAEVRPAAFAEDFEADEPLAGWQTTGDVTAEAPGHAGSHRSLVLQRTLDALPAETHALGKPFAASPGPWQVAYAWRSKLHSPDNSYHAAVALEALDRQGKVLESVPAGIGYGQNNWQTAAYPVELPAGTAQARLRVQLNKTYGSFRLDRLSIAPLRTGPTEKRIDRVLLATDVLGNLFLPGQDVVFRATVEAIKPLPAEEQVLRYSLRDCRGVEQIEPGKCQLTKGPRSQGRFTYTSEIRLPRGRLAVGKYFELHVSIPRGTAEPVREYSGVAILPSAASKDYKPEEIPFTIRNWDSRVPVYFDLADRLGLRLIGLWGGWSSKPPYEPHCPGVERCAELGAKWITGTPAASIEREGFSTYSEESLRAGMKNFLEQYADRGLAMIAMGNEPHGKGEKVLDNVRAYRAIYETVKAFDPDIHVIGTSVEPNEEYFRAGYHNYLDSYDFHIYEHYTNVRRTIQQYRELMQKYDAVKPIHSTELGLNSQGQTRLAVATEMIKKFTVFFAEGGATASWFTIQYPDPKGRARGQFGDSHCVFDCKYNLYNPRLDAVTYYNIVNGICDKRFVNEKHYPGGAQAYLFRDGKGKCLHVLWSDDARQDVQLPLPAGKEVELIYLDGSRSTLRSGANGVTLTAWAEPVLLAFRNDRAGLPPVLKPPAVELKQVPADVARGDSLSLVLEAEGLRAESIRLGGAALWKTAVKQSGPGQVTCTAEVPIASPAREALLTVGYLKNGQLVGQLAVPVKVTSPSRTRSG